MLCCVCGVLGHLAPGHRCACSVCHFLVRCPGPLGSCSPVCSLGVLCCVCGVAGHLAPVQRCARQVLCFSCAVSWATWLLFTVVPARCVVLRVRCPGRLAPVQGCVRSLCCVACAVSWATWLLFTGVPARLVVLRVRCPGPLGSCSPVCSLGLLCCVCGVLCRLAPVHRCACLVRCFACAVSWATWLLFTGVLARCVVLRVRCPGPLGSCSPVRPLGVLLCLCNVLGHLAPVHRCACWVCPVVCMVFWAPCSCSPVCPLGLLCCVCGVLGHLAPVHRCARLVRCFACAVSWAPCSCSPVCLLCLLCCVCGVLGHLAPVHRCVRSACCVACAVSWANWLLFTGAPAWCVALLVRCPGPLGSCSPICPLAVLCCVLGVLGHLAPVHRCVRSACCVACAVSLANWLLFTGAPAWCVALLVRCPGPLGSCSAVCPLVVLCCVCGVLGHLAPVHRCARSVCCVACAVSWATWLLFTGVSARLVVLRVRCPWPIGSCSPVSPLGALLCLCGVLGHLAPAHRCARSLCCVAGAVSWATWLLFTGAPTRCVALLVQCPEPLGSCSPVRPLGMSCCVYGVLGPLLLFTGVPAQLVVLRLRCPGPLGSCTPVRALGALLCFCGVLSPLLLITSVSARLVVLCVRCPGPIGSCSPVRPLGALLCLCGVLGHLAPVHRCACSLCCVACAVSWATLLLFTGVPVPCIVLRVWCPGPIGSCSPVCPLAVLCCVCGVLGYLAPAHRCASLVCCVSCAVSWATWLLFTEVPARCVVLCVRCRRPLGSCSPVCPLSLLCCVCGVLGQLASVHRCVRLVLCFACVVSWATWLWSPGVPVRCVVLRVRCPGPIGSCSAVCPLGFLCCVCGVLGYLPPVHRSARSVCCVSCAVSPATWLLFTGFPAQRVVLRVRCPGPLGSCSPVCPLGLSCCVCGVLGPLAPVHRCARLVRCFACAVSWAN